MLAVAGCANGGGLLGARPDAQADVYVHAWSRTPRALPHVRRYVSPYGAATAVGAERSVPIEVEPPRTPLGEEAPLFLRLDARGRVFEGGAHDRVSVSARDTHALPVSVHIAEARVHGALMPEAVTLIARMHGFELAACGTALSGRTADDVHVTFDIDSDGRAQGSEARSAISSHGSCVARVVRSWAFPPMSEPSRVAFTVELRTIEL